VYPSHLEVLQLADRSHHKYTELVEESDFHKMADAVVVDLLEGLKVGVLQFRNKLAVAILPLPITELPIQDISQVLCLSPKGPSKHPRTTYLAVLAEETSLKIYELEGLRQVAEVELPSAEATLELEADPSSEFIVAHYLHKKTGRCLNNVVYKVNSRIYYDPLRQPLDNASFILYRIELRMHHNLSPLSFREDGDVNWFDFCFLDEGQITLVRRKVARHFRQPEESIQCLTDPQFWREVPEWQDIISTYLQLQAHSSRPSYSEEERQLEEYYQITKDFDSIVDAFSQLLAQKGRRRLTREEVEAEWQEYLLEVAQERGFKL
jgi:hypothetical protein